MKRSIFLALPMIFSMSAYSEVVFDNSSNEKMKSSFKSIKESLTTEKQMLFKTAFTEIATRTVGIVTIQMLQSDAEDKKTIVQTLAIKMLGEKLEGKSASDVFKEGQRLIDQQIDGIERSATEALLAKSNIESVTVDRIDYKINPSKQKGYKQFLLDVTVTNGSNVALSTIYLACTFRTPDRKTPWYERKTDYKIPGGIEPGETLSIQIEPNFFGWDNSEVIPKQAKISAVVFKVKDAHNIEIWEASDESLNQLDKLKSLKDLSASLAAAQ